MGASSSSKERDEDQPIGATRVITGTDVDYGALTHLLVAALSSQPGFDLRYNRQVVALDREAGGRWKVTIEDTYDGTRETVSAGFVFIGAGGASLDLLQKSEIPEGRGYGGFPVSGIWLRCDDSAISHRHHAKVYGKAASGSPPMSVPHLDTRIIGGQTSLLFGPYAGFSSKFLKHGSLTDLFGSITPDNIVPLLDVARDNMSLTEYLIGQVLKVRAISSRPSSSSFLRRLAMSGRKLSPDSVSRSSSPTKTGAAIWNSGPNSCRRPTGRL